MRSEVPSGRGLCLQARAFQMFNTIRQFSELMTTELNLAPIDIADLRYSDGIASNDQIDSNMSPPGINQKTSNA